MNLWRVKYGGDGIADTAWFPSKAAADGWLASDEVASNEYKCAAPEKVDVPTDKKGLLHFLNHYEPNG